LDTRPVLLRSRDESRRLELKDPFEVREYTQRLKKERRSAWNAEYTARFDELLAVGPGPALPPSSK
jgi:hypothetical protein